MVGTLSEPFPHTQPWNELSGKPVFDTSREMDQTYEDAYWQTVSAWQETLYWNSRLVNGAIPICHKGCALRDWLVVTGPERGHVWCDHRADEAGLFPLQHPSRDRVTFIQWYLDWLYPWR